MEKLLVLSHVSAGGVVLLLGLLNFANRKGGRSHVRSGRVYVGAMWWICLSAILMMVFIRFSFFLLVITVLTFYSTFVGLRVLRRKKSPRGQWYDWAVSGFTALFGAGLLLYGIQLLLLHGPVPLAILSLVFGVGTGLSGWQDIRFFHSPTADDRLWWLRQHISAMGGSYIAAVTAFAVQNSEYLIPIDSLEWLTWILPAAIGTPFLSFFTNKYYRKQAAL